MKAKKILKILCVVFAVLFALTVVGGIVYGCIKDGITRGNSNTAGAGYADCAPANGVLSKYNARSMSNSAIVPYADTVTTPTTTKGTCTYTVYAPVEAFPITLYGYNGTSKKSTVVKNNGDTVTVVSYWYRDTTTNQVRCVTQGSITYFLAVDCNGLMLYLDFGLTDDETEFPISAVGMSDSSYNYSQIGFCYESSQPCELFSHGYSQGLDKGYQNGYDDGYHEGEIAHEEDYGDGYNQGKTDGYEEGKTAGYNSGYLDGESDGYSEGHSVGYDEGYDDGSDEGRKIGYDLGYSTGKNEGYDLGYDDGSEEGKQMGYDLGHSTGYREGYADGENKAVSLQITNPISAFLQPVHEFMNTKFFGDLTYASIFNVVLFVAVALIFIKMFSGG